MGRMECEAELSKMDFVLEAEALRRVISAYLNYASAAEDDVLRWEKSFLKLRPDHKALLKQMPVKFAWIRSCAGVNMYFIRQMLKVFSPPFEMKYFALGACKVPQNTSNSADSKVTDNKLGKRTQFDDFPVEMKAGYSASELVTDVTVSKHYHTAVDSQIEQKTTNKRLASEITCPSRPFCEEEVSQHNIRLRSGETKIVQPIPYCSNRTEVGKMNSNDLTRTFAPHEMSLSNDEFVNSTGGFHNAPSEKDSDCHDQDLTVDEWGIDMEVRCIIRNIVRDWSEEGFRERKECFSPILKELEDWFPNRSRTRPPTCLVPGAGLGRLAFEIARLGFETQANEFSYYMMICSSFILNGTNEALEWVIHPWIHSSCNNFTDEDQLRAVRFPDLHPASVDITGGFSMCAGDFLEVYRHPDQKEAWDAVVTCFFIDTAHNVLEYLEVIATVLKPGGLWVNLGPLLYHFADTQEMSVELSLSDVRRLATHVGLSLKKEKTIKTTYSSNIRSMMQNYYTTSFWTMVKET